MATDTRLHRRVVLGWLAGLGAGLGSTSHAAAAPDLLAAWQQGSEQHIGVIRLGPRHWSVAQALTVPTRAHGLVVEARGSVLAVARRPGDWLLRWHPDRGRVQWHWVEDERRFNGHVIASPDGRTLWTTETELETAQGRLAVRDAASLAKTGEWSTHGQDPHQLLVLPSPLGDCPAGTLMVANGGIPTLPETGRAKRDLMRMDASLVALHPATGEPLGQWRLSDPRLSIRHLAWDPVGQRLGVALQAEHADPSDRLAAPVLAVWDGRTLTPARAQPALAGYGGDIVSLPQGGFAVSCPRADSVALFDAQGLWQRELRLAGAYALARSRSAGWVSGAPQILNLSAPQPLAPPARLGEWTWDNHWAALSPR